MHAGAYALIPLHGPGCAFGAKWRERRSPLTQPTFLNLLINPHPICEWREKILLPTRRVLCGIIGPEGNRAPRLGGRTQYEIRNGQEVGRRLRPNTGLHKNLLVGAHIKVVGSYTPLEMRDGRAIVVVRRRPNKQSPLARPRDNPRHIVSKGRAMLPLSGLPNAMPPARFAFDGGHIQSPALCSESQALQIRGRASCDEIDCIQSLNNASLPVMRRDLCHIRPHKLPIRRCSWGLMR